MLARCVRDKLVDLAAAAARAAFRTKLFADLKLHVYLAHRLTKPAPPPVLPPCESLAKLEERAKARRTICQGAYTAKAGLASFTHCFATGT